MAKKPRPPLEAALDVIGGFLPSLTGKDESRPLDGVGVAFFDADEGGWVSLDKEETRRYQECLASLRRASEEETSRRTIERLLQEAIFRCLDIQHKQCQLPMGWR